MLADVCVRACVCVTAGGAAAAGAGAQTGDASDEQFATAFDTCLSALGLTPDQLLPARDEPAAAADTAAAGAGAGTQEPGPMDTSTAAGDANKTSAPSSAVALLGTCILTLTCTPPGPVAFTRLHALPAAKPAVKEVRPKTCLVLHVWHVRVCLCSFCFQVLTRWSVAQSSPWCRTPQTSQALAWAIFFAH